MFTIIIGNGKFVYTTMEGIEDDEICGLVINERPVMYSVDKSERQDAEKHKSNGNEEKEIQEREIIQVHFPVLSGFIINAV